MSSSARVSIGCGSEHSRAHAPSRTNIFRAYPVRFDTATESLSHIRAAKVRISCRHWSGKEHAAYPGRNCQSVPRWLREVTAAAGQHSADVLVAPPDLSCWRSFRAQLVGTEAQSKDSGTNHKTDTTGTWCHRIAGAEQGCLLLSNTPGMGFFERAVILVVEHTSKRSLGLMLNKQAGVQIQDLAIKGSIMQVFGQMSLRLGGPHLPSNLHLLHGQHQVTDTVMMCPGLYTGGLQSSLQLVSEGIVPADSFSLLAGYTGWQPGQLEAEIDQGSWIPVSTDSQTVLDIACRDAACGTAWSSLLSFLSAHDRLHVDY